MNDVYVARQAIYNRSMGVYAYELLYRAGLDNKAEFPDAMSATTQVLLNTFMEIGLDGLAGNSKVFINMPQRFFIDLPPIPFAKDRLVLELLEDLEVDENLVTAVKKLKAAGYTLAIDDYMFEGKWEPLLSMVDIIKVEIMGLTEQQLCERIHHLKPYKLTLLAEKVETHKTYELCRDLGFELFQGYFFSKPKVVQGKKLDDNQVVVLRLLEKLNDPEAAIEDIDKLICLDAGLSYKVLRYVNSAAMGLPKKVDSIRRAILLMGLKKIRAWASLMAMTGIKGKPTEVLALALVRAMFCESLLKERGTQDTDCAFTTGLFSMLDVMLDQPLVEILTQLPLAETIGKAILDHQGPDGEALACAIAYERHDWPNMVFSGVDTQRVHDIYWEVVGLVWQSGLIEG
jgi:EAL and modified HD-GYP domain-containing signal transduction protein